MGFVSDIVGGITGSNKAADAAGKASDTQLEATRESNKLIREIYDQDRADLAPWRNAGSSALNQLMQLVGLPAPAAGGASGTGDLLTEAQLRQQLTPEFTTQNANVNPPSLQDLGWRGNYNNATWNYDPNAQKWGYQIAHTTGGDADEMRTTWQYANDWQPGGGSTLDEAGLNAEIQKRLAAQQSAPPAATPTGTAGTNSINDILTADPGFQFRLDQGQQALDRQQAARGSLLSGRAMKDTSAYNSGMASQEFGNVFNRLAGIAGVGQQATNTTAQMGQSFGQQASSNIIQGGNARASGYLAKGQAAGNGFNSLLNAAGTGAALWTAFSDRRLKRNIRRIGTHASGLPWYEFDYVWGEHSQGVMADEAQAVSPEAVSTHASGYLMVNYGAL